MTNKFKAGDVVRCVLADYELVFGETYIVFSYNSSGREIFVRDKNGNTSGSWRESRFELVPRKMTIEEKIALAESMVGKQVQHKQCKDYKGIVQRWDIVRKGNSFFCAVYEQADKDGYAISIHYQGFVSPIELVELVAEIPDELVLNSRYTAKIWNDRVEVGCQTFPKAIIEELYKKLQARK